MKFVVRPVRSNINASMECIEIHAGCRRILG